jgi:hypothetical protein
MKLFKTAVNNAKTHDIIYSLCIAAPAAIKQAKQFNLPEIIGLTGGNLENDAILTGKWIRNNVKYKIDSFDNQNIQLPSALLNSKSGDCKSISLLFLAIMEAAGYNGGFRFAGYRGKNFTHVYNFFDNKNKLYTFDACINDLKEHKTYTNIKDMKVNYLAGTPMMIDETGINRQPTARELMQDDRILGINGIGKKKKFTKIKNFVNKVGKLTKTVALAPARGSFLLLVNLNFRALSKRLTKLKNKNENQFAEWWTKLGGDIDKLNKAIEKGSTKKPLFGAKKGIDGIGVDYEYMGEPVTAATIGAALTSAAGIIAALNKLLKKEGVAEEPGEELGEGLDPDAPLSPELEPGEPVIPNDPASDGAASYIEKGINFLKGVTGNKPKVKVKPRQSQSGSGLQAGNLTNQETTGFKPSPLLIGGGIAAIAAIYLLTKKKGK